MCGVDCVWLDREHVPNDLRDIENQIRAAKVHDVDTVVRVPRGSYSDLVHPLEMDAAGIMVPHRDEPGRRPPRRVANAVPSRRPPARWTAATPTAPTAWCPRTTTCARPISERFVIVQIEDPEPMPDLEQIAQLDGIDMLFFGPGDFSQGIGDPGNFDEPQVDRGAPPDRRNGAPPRQVRRHRGLVSTRWRQPWPWATSSSASAPMFSR